MMKLRKVIWTLCLLLPLSSVGQSNRLSFAEYDALTYSLYLQQKWDSLIIIGEEALDDSIDYFYLRMRVGVAYYSKSKFRKAIPHFERASAFNSSDTYLHRYLYYSYLYSGRVSDALFFARTFPHDLRKELNCRTVEPVNGVFAESGYSVNDNLSTNGNLDIDGTENVFGSQDITDDLFYSTLSISHKAGSRLLINQAFTYMTIHKFRRSVTNRTIAPFDITTPYVMTQKEYYISANTLLSRGLVFTPAFHYLNTGYNVMTYRINKGTGEILEVAEDTTFQNYAASLALSREMGKFTLEGNTSFGNLNGRRQLLLGAAVSVYPLQNLNFYSRTQFIFKSTRKTAGEASNPLLRISAVNAGPGPGPGGPGSLYSSSVTYSDVVFEELLGFKTTRWMWTELFLTSGNMMDYIEKNAYLVNNLSDRTKLRSGITLLILPRPNLEISLRGIYSRNDSFYTRFIFSPELGVFQPLPTVTQYKSVTFIGGIKWKL